MFITVTAINGHAKPNRIGIRFIALVEPYDEPSEPSIKAVVTLATNRTLYVSESYDEVNARIDVAQNQ